MKSERRAPGCTSRCFGLVLVALVGLAMWATPAGAASTDFNQCGNDSNNDNVKDDCEWTTGSIGSTNSIYVEGDSVPQRLFQTIDTAGSHTIRLEYQFTNGSTYAFDFLTTADLTQSGALLHQCGDLPSFVPASTCSNLFAAKALVAIPSDPFDGVSLRENPPGAGARNFVIRRVIVAAPLSLSLRAPTMAE